MATQALVAPGVTRPLSSSCACCLLLPEYAIQAQSTAQFIHPRGHLATLLSTIGNCAPVQVGEVIKVDTSKSEYIGRAAS